MHHFKMAMATFCARKLARKKNGRFQITAVKGRKENFLDSRKRSRVMQMLKCAFHSECESDTELSGRRVVELGLLSKELADGCHYCNASFMDIENHSKT